jgi:hypothetical protein
VLGDPSVDLSRRAADDRSGREPAAEAALPGVDVRIDLDGRPRVGVDGRSPTDGDESGSKHGPSPYPMTRKLKWSVLVAFLLRYTRNLPVDGTAAAIEMPALYVRSVTMTSLALVIPGIDTSLNV